MRLIDADALIKVLNKEIGWVETTEVKIKIMEQPTAYDIDKIAETINLHIKSWEDESFIRRDIAEEHIKALNWALKIVKGGGKE